MNKQYIVIVSILTLFPFEIHAESTHSTYVSPESIVSVDSMLQMVAGLLLVLCLIGAAAWVLKRFSIFPQTVSGGIKIVASASVGQRERVVIVEVEGTRLILGVTPQQINTLHSLPKISVPDSGVPSRNSVVKESFSEKFSSKLDNKHDEQTGQD